MPEYQVLSIRAERPEETKLREWFATQALETPRNLEDAARLITGLVTGLLGALLGVLTLAADPLPAYLDLQFVRWLAIIAVGFLLLSVLAALGTLIPRRWATDPKRPLIQRETFNQLIAEKSRSLYVAVILFALGLVALGGVILTALFTFH